MAEMEQIRDFLSKSALQIITNIIALVVYSVILFTYSWKITLLGLGLLALLFITVGLYRNKLQENYDAAFEAQKEAQSLVAEQVTAISSIKASGAEDIMRFRWGKGLFARRTIQAQTTTPEYGYWRRDSVLGERHQGRRSMDLRDDGCK